MHLPDGTVPLAVCAGGYGLAGAVTWFSFGRAARQGDPNRDIPRASVLAAGFFVASMIHIPVPPASVHPLLCGLMGMALGWYAFPAVLVGLFFQAAMFSHGGLTTLGVNAVIMGLPALGAGWISRLLHSKGLPFRGFAAGFAGVAGAVILFSAAVLLSIPGWVDPAAERAALAALAVAHLPLAVGEGVFTGAVALFIARVRPGMFA